MLGDFVAGSRKGDEKFADDTIFSCEVKIGSFN